MVASITNSLCIGTYNCQHFSQSSIDYIKSVLSQCHFLFVQEHCLFLSQLFRFNDIGDICYHGTSAMDENKFNIGRPHGGCAILWHTALNCTVTPISCDNNRLCCVLVTFSNNLTALLVNVYMPCDERYSGNSLKEVQDILNDLTAILYAHNHDMVIFGGDLNADFKRNTPHVNCIKNMLKIMNLKSGVDNVVSNVDYTFESKGTGCRSLIDHVCISDNVFHTLTAYHTIQSIDNMSDHDTLLCNLDVVDVTHSVKEYKMYTARPAWYKAHNEDINKYMDSVNVMLQNIDIPYNALHCKNLRCTEHEHVIESFHNDIVTACLHSEWLYIPKTTNNFAKCVPGWNDYVRAKRLKSLYCHELWKAAGKPMHGDLATNMRLSRKDYHYSIRFCKRQKSQIQAHKMAESLSKNQTRDFWKEVKQFKQSHKTVTTIVDDAEDPQAIANLFYNKFKTVYTSVPYDQHEMNCLVSDIDNHVDVSNAMLTNDFECFSVNNIAKLVKKLKSGKHDGNKGVTSDCLIHGPQRLFVCLSLLFKLMVTHCYIPKHLLVGTMFPLPKVKGLTCVSDKYRAITLSSCVLKLFDLMVLTSEKPSMHTDVLQFGFKPECSTTLCSTMLNEVCRFYNANKSNVYALLLDATKAFDRVNYIKLFKLLIKRGVNALFVRVLLKMYTNQKLRVNWQNYLSEEFAVTNGVRQGGILSPILFIVYIDELLQKLRDSGYGCYIGPHFTGALAYADDIVLISPTKKGLKTMADICVSYSNDYKIVFNASKSQYCVFRNKYVSSNTNFAFSNVTLEECSVVTHLGHKIFCISRNHNVEGVIAAFYKQYNMFKCNFKELPSAIQADLFQRYCSSFYGCLLIPFSSLNNLQVAWRKSVRQIWRLSYRTHCSIVRCLIPGVCDLHMFVGRFMKFFLNMYNHSADVIRYMSHLAVFQGGSILHENFVFCCDKLKVRKDELLTRTGGNIYNFVTNVCSNDCKSNNVNASIVKELCNVRDKLYECPLSKSQIELIINDLCIN